MLSTKERTVLGRTRNRAFSPFFKKWYLCASVCAPFKIEYSPLNNTHARLRLMHQASIDMHFKRVHFYIVEAPFHSIECVHSFENRHKSANQMAFDRAIKNDTYLYALKFILWTLYAECHGTERKLHRRHIIVEISIVNFLLQSVTSIILCACFPLLSSRVEILLFCCLFVCLFFFPLLLCCCWWWCSCSIQCC